VVRQPYKPITCKGANTKQHLQGGKAGRDDDGFSDGWSEGVDDGARESTMGPGWEDQTALPIEPNLLKATDGWSLGALVGRPEGDADGLRDGWSEGDDNRATLGRSDGLPGGVALGASDGVLLGATVVVILLQ
jgi:hypothetical protein